MTAAEGRKEIDMVPPASPVTMPAPVCPEGRVCDEWADQADEPPPEPGVSPLDAMNAEEDAP